MIVAGAFTAMLALLFFGVPIGFGMAIVGVAGFMAVSGIDAGFAMLGQVLFDSSLSYELSVLPLFILMGNLITRSRMSEELYVASNAFLGHRRGGLAMATVAACGGFSAVCGSSMATVATMGKVALPQMERFGYSHNLACASVAAGGTLGILIPPSVVLVLYGILTGTDIGALFAAGMLPGLLGIFLYMAAVRWVTAVDPEAGPQGARTPWPARWKSLSRIWVVLLLFVVILGGIYGGVFTPTEAAGIGAFGAFLIALARRTLTWRVLGEVLIESSKTSAMMFMVFIGALLFSNFVNIARFPYMLADFVSSLSVSPLMVIAVLFLIYIILGAVLESLSMMLLTVPVFFPLVTQFGFDPVWFGIFVVVVIEVGLITPPLGMNAFVLKAVDPNVRMGGVFRGLVPFIAADFVRVGLIVAFPSIALFLPQLFAG